MMLRNGRTSEGGGVMNWSEMQTNWTEMSPLVQTHWPQLTHTVLGTINGDRGCI